MFSLQKFLSRLNPFSCIFSPAYILSSYYIYIYSPRAARSAGPQPTLEPFSLVYAKVRLITHTHFVLFPILKGKNPTLSGIRIQI